jgi:hypothetical protein
MWRQHFPIDPEVERLAVGEHAVEIEDDASQRHGRLAV